MSVFRRDDRGQSVVLIAISLPLILTLLLLVIDGGRLYVERERIRDAAQLAAEAAVSLAADEPEARAPKDADVRAMVADALSRNLGGEAYSYDVAIPYRKDIGVFNVKVSVTKPFRSSIAAVGFTIGADAAAKLGQGGGTGGAAPPAGASATPTARPTATPCAASLSTSTSAIAVGGSVRVRWSAGGCGFSRIELGVWPAGRTYGCDCIVSWLQDPGPVSGTMSYTLPAKGLDSDPVAGNSYVVRLLSPDFATELASASITVIR